MDCKENQTILNEDFAGRVLIGKTTVMGLLLLTCVLGNLTLVFRAKRKGRKWIASDWFLWILGGVGMANGLLNISVHLLSLVSGKSTMLSIILFIVFYVYVNIIQHNI